MLPGLHVAVFFFSALLTVGSGDEVSVDLCKLPDGVFPDPDSCEDFIRCQSGVPDVEPCPDSLLFNPLKLTCDFSKTGNCSEPEDFDETSTPVETNDVVCSEEGPNVYPIQSSCTEYYMCDNDTAFKVKCPKDLLMNADKLTCDYPENVDCDSVSSPEESTVGMKAVYEDDDKDLESETKTSVTFLSTDTSSPSAEPAVQIKSETDFDSKEMTGYTLNEPEETTSAKLDATGNVISDKSVSPNPEITSTYGYLDENITSKISTLKETSLPKQEDSSFEVKPTQTNSDQDITVKTSVFTSTSNVNDEVISSTSDAHRERSNLEDSTTENNVRDILTSPDTTVTDLSSNTFHDFTSSESSEQSFGDKSVTAIQTPDDKGINDTGSGSDIDIINIFTTYSNNASQQIDVSTNDISTSNSLISTVANEHNLNTKASSSDKSITSDSLSGTLENVSTLDSEVELTTKTTDLEKSEGTSTETTKSEVSLSASYELTSQTDVTDNKASMDNLTSVVKSTETIVTDSNFNESTTRSSVLTSLGSLEIKNESYFEDTTKIPTVVETDKIAPEKTLTTNPALMSSDPLTDNETTKITTSTFSETVKVTPKYMTNTATTEEHPSFDAETSESTSLSDDQNEEYEVFTESVVESNWTLTPESNFFTELSTVGLEHIVSSQPTETSIISDVNTEILDINDITSEDTISNRQSSLSNEDSTSSLLQQNSDSTSKSHFINELINTEAITSSENISSGHISENVVVETHEYISSETTFPVSTEMDNLTESVINVETVMSHSTDLTSENQNPTLTSTHLKLTTGDDLITASHLPTRQNTKATEIASVEISDMLYSTSVSTEHPTNTNAFSGSTNSGDNDIDLQISSLKTQQPDETTEKIDLSSESDVTKVDQTYIDMYTNNSTSSLENSSDESFAASTADLESLTYNSSSAGTSENLKLGSSEIVISSVSERFQSTHTESSSDLTTTLLHTRTEVADISVTSEQTSEDDFDSSKSTSKNTRINSKETELPYKIQSSTLSEVLTNFSGSDVVTSTKESLSSDLMTSLHHQSEKSTQISETGMDFGGITLSTSGVTDPENILTTENKGTSTDVSSDTLNDATTTVFIHTSSNTIAGNASETILSSTGQIDDSTPSSLSKNTDIFEITSDSLGPGSVTRPGATLTSSEITENLKLVSTHSYTLQNNSTESTTEINKTPNVSKETSKAFVSNSTASNTVIDVGTTSSIENITNMYEESSTSDATDPFKNTSVVTVSSFIEVTNETSESFWPETKEIATENNRASILHASTTIMGLISDTIQSTISEVTSIASTTDMDGETTSSDISSSAVSYSKDSFASTSAIATKQNYISTLSTLQIATSEDSTSDSSNSTHMILPITYFNDSDNNISTIDEASESPKYDSNNVTETSTSVITSTKAYSSDENTSLANVKSTKAPMIQVTTEFISTKLNSEEPDAYETSQFTGRRFEESLPNSQTNFDIVSRNTLSTEWPTKSTTGVQSIPSDSISSDESTSDITSSDVMTESTFKTSGTSTKTTTYKETSEPETVSKDNTFPSPGNLVSSTDTLFESTSLSSLKVTSETTSKPITETSRDITDGNILSTSSNISIYSSEIDSSTVDPTKISESTDLFTDFKRETVPMTAETDGDLSTNDETESTDSIIKIISTSTSTSKFATEISKESTIDITSFSRIIATETGNPFSITATTKGNNLINDRTTETTPKTSNTDSISIYSKTLPEDKGETDSSTVDPTKISESTDLFTDSKRETVPTTTETGGGLSTKNETESTDSIIEIQSTSTATSKFATEISRESTIDTTSFSRIIATETGNPFPITATTRDTTKGNNLINDRTETTPKSFNTDSISISSKTLPEDKGETDSSTVDPTKLSESTDLSTDSKLETVPTTVETDGGLSTKDKTESTHSIIKILSTSTATSKFATDISRESTIHTTSFSRIIATETGNPFPITATTHDTTKENNLINDRTTETHQKTSNTDSISIASKTLPEDKGETNHIFSTTDSSVVKTTVMKTSSKDISESDLQPMSTTEMSVLINDTNERFTESNTDFTSVSMASRNLEEETNSIEYSSTTYFPSDLRTETSHSSPNTDIESENKEISATDRSSSGTTVTKTHSKDISESDLPVVPTTETTLLIFNYTSKTTTESITDVSNVSITSRNIIGKTESTEDPSTTYIPAAFRTETSVSSANTDTESEFQRISSTDIPSESTTTVNPICVTSEGSFPYPDDCNKFYRCTKGVPVQSSCVGNEHFDPVKRICTNPCLAKCDPNADCGTTESKTNAEETTSSQTMPSKGVSSTSELYNTGTEETSVATTPDDFIEDTTPNKISKSTSEETSTITNSAFRSSILESTTEKLGTDYFTSDESPPSVADINATKDLTEISSDDYMSTRTIENVTTSDDSNPITSDVPITSTTVTNEIPPETQTEVFEVSSSTTKTSTETSSSVSSEFTVTTDITPESSGDGEDSSSTSTLITSTKCENGDCLSSKSATSATLVPFRLCHRNDFLSQPKCSEYLDCTGKEPKILVCPNGLHFNPSTRVCDWPYSAECGTSPKPLYEPTDLLKCPCKSCLIPSTKSCSHYYLCIGFTAYEMKCSNSLYFDRIRNTCNYAPLVDCSHLTSTSTTTEIEPSESSTKTSTLEISTSTKASTTPASFVCPSQEGLFRYPGNCGMFYQCANWYPYVMNCAATTHFSEITQRCEYPCDAKCDLTLNCGISSTAPPSDPRCSCNNCRLPSPDSCTKYIICVNGRARIEYCPWGKTFDARRSTCDWAHKVTCHPSAMCPERNGLFSHKDDCHKFVHCSNGIPYVKNCPSILEFDPIKKRCEWPNGRCNYLPINTRDVDYKNVEHRKGWKCPKIFGYYPVDQHCNKFYYCSFGTPTLKECSPGLLYNPRYQTCDWKKQVRCNSNRHLKPRKCRVFDHHVVCSEDRRPKLHVLCNMYYDCTAGRACAKQCPVGLYFNNMTGVCDLPENVKCLNHGEGDYSLKELSVKCASGDHGRQVNPTNDSCFYHCRQGKVVSGCCSKGHVYNVHKDKCERRTKSLRI